MPLPDKFPTSPEETEIVSKLLPDAIRLLEKDFQTAGIDISFSSNSIADVYDLREIIAQHIAKTGGPGSEGFYRLLYRADIPESKTREALAAGPERPFDEVIAELLVIRALQRTWFRKKYG
ncbi:MAG TPA: hypothetical protein VI731_03525 [Bacteroidia bacterium]|nr:hypothetical protein [Bacteroidia bacterium]